MSWSYKVEKLEYCELVVCKSSEGRMVFIPNIFTFGPSYSVVPHVQSHRLTAVLFLIQL